MQTTGAQNTATGVGSLAANTTGSNNTASIIYNALNANTTGAQNTATGVGSLAANTTGSNNTAQGYNALNATLPVRRIPLQVSDLSPLIQLDQIIPPRVTTRLMQTLPARKIPQQVSDL